MSTIQWWARRWLKEHRPNGIHERFELITHECRRIMSHVCGHQRTDCDCDWGEAGETHKRRSTKSRRNWWRPNTVHRNHQRQSDKPHLDVAAFFSAGLTLMRRTQWHRIVIFLRYFSFVFFLLATQPISCQWNWCFFCCFFCSEIFLHRSRFIRIIYIYGMWLKIKFNMLDSLKSMCFFVNDLRSKLIAIGCFSLVAWFFAGCYFFIVFYVPHCDVVYDVMESICLR